MNACGALAFVAALRGVIPRGCGVVSAAHCLLRVGDRAAATAARRGANSPAYICIGCGWLPTAAGKLQQSRSGAPTDCTAAAAATLCATRF